MFTAFSERTYCTDFSISVQSSSGALIKKMNLSRSANIVVGFYGVAWASEIRLANGISAATWSVVTRLDLSKNYPINSSPGNEIMSLNFDLIYLLES